MFPNQFLAELTLSETKRDMTTAAAAFEAMNCK
jgi:hypothetical protein